MNSVALEMELRNPLRALDWRRRMAAALHQRGVVAAAVHEDGCLATTLRFLEERDRGRQLGQGLEGVREFAPILGALELSESPASIRAIVEAGILSGESSEVTAGRVSLPSGAVVDAFESLHYCVRDRLRARAWIQVAAIGMTRTTDSPETRRLRLLKKLAYRGGPVVLDISLGAFGWPGRQSTEAGPAGTMWIQSMQRRIQLMEILEDPAVSLQVVVEICDEFRNLTDVDLFALKSIPAPSRIVQELVLTDRLTPEAATTDPETAVQAPDAARAA